MQEIQAIIERVDLRWDEGFITKDEYLEKRRQLQAECEALRPVDYDQLHEAADLLERFRTYWDGCAELANPLEARKQLITKIVDRVLVYDQSVVAVVLHGQFALVLGKNHTAPVSIADAVAQVLVAQGISTSLDSSKCGSDGVQTLLCTRFCWFRHSRHGGAERRSRQISRLIIVIYMERAEAPLVLIFPQMSLPHPNRLATTSVHSCP
jgi:hypothetical protein